MIENSNTRRTRSICFVVSVDVDRFPDKKLDGMLRDRNTRMPLSPAQVRFLCYEFRHKGYEVIPTCDNHDERGYCKGHEETIS